MRMQQAGIIDPRALQQARQNPRVQMAEGLASSGIAGALKELIDDRVTMEAMELVAAADRDEAAKMTDKPSIKDSNTQGINQLVQTLAPGMQLRNNQIQKAQMQKMLGLGGQPAPNMRMADGGIVGFEESGKMQPIPMLMQKYGSEKVMEFLNEQKRFRDIEGNVSPQAREQFEMMKANIESRFDPEMIRAIRQAQSGPDEMADGGIVALKKGGFPDLSGDGKVTQKDILMGRGVVDKAQGGIVSFDNGGSVIPQVGIFGPAIYDFTDFLLSKGIENISDLSSSAIESLTREFEEQKAAGDARAALADMGDAPGSRGTPQARPEIAEVVEREAIGTGRPPVEQMGNLGQVLKGGVLGLLDTIKPEPRSTLMADMGDAPGSRGTPQARPEEPPLSEFQQSLRDVGELNIEQQLLDAERRMQREQGTDSLGIASRALDPRIGRQSSEGGGLSELLTNFGEGFGIEDFKISDEQRRAAFPRYTQYDEDDPFARRFGAALRDAFGLPGRGVGAAVGAVGDVIEPVATDFYAGFTEEGPSSEADVQAIIAEGGTPPRIETEETPTGEVNVEKPSRTEIDAATVEAMKSEESPTEVGPETFRTETFQETLALDPSTTGYEEKLDEIMQRANSPTRILATFLQGVGEGKTIGQGLMAGGKAIAAAERAYDAQEIQLRGLLEQQRISQQNFNMNMQKIANEKEQLRILEDRYITQGKNEAARVKATEKYYEVLASGQTSGLRNALIDALVAYEGSTLYYQELADELGVDVTDLDRVKNRQAVQDAQSRIRENYRQRLLSGSRTSAGAGTNINTALPEGVTVTRQD